MPIPDLADVDRRPLEMAVADYFEAARSITVKSVNQTRIPKAKRSSHQRELFPDDSGAQAETNDDAADELRILHWRIDAEVLRLYDLPAELERRLLDLFTGVRRRGVPFEQTEYFPKDFTDLNRLSDLLAITAGWPKTNRRRAKLIDLEEERRLTPVQREELEELQRLADAHVSLRRPVQMERADEIIDNLKRAGLWEEPN